MSVAVGKVELEVPEGIGGAGPLPDEDLRSAGRDGFPVDAVGRKHARIGAPARQHLITPRRQIGVPSWSTRGAISVRARSAVTCQ